MKRIMINNLNAKEMETRNLNKIESLCSTRCTISVCVKSTWNVFQVCDKIIHWSQLKTGVGGQNLIFFYFTWRKYFQIHFSNTCRKKNTLYCIFSLYRLFICLYCFFFIYLTLHEKSSLWGLYYLSMMRKNQNGKYSEFRDFLCTQTLVLNALFSRISRITSETQMISLIVIIHRQKSYFVQNILSFWNIRVTSLQFNISREICVTHTHRNINLSFYTRSLYLPLVSEKRG